MARLAAWSVGLSLAFVGSQVAHALTYAAAAPDAHRRADLLQQTGHSYFAYLPFVLALLAATALLGLVARVAVTESRTVLGWPIALLPALTFVVQEHLERLEQQAQFPWHALVEPTFVPGLVLQLPLGVLAYVVARALLRGAERVGRFLRARSPRASAHAPRVRRVPSAETPHVGAVASGAIARGPPASVAG